MNNLLHTLFLVFVMALVTYLIRMLPLVLFRKEIKNVYIRSFLFYVPYAVLGAMTFPAIFSSTASLFSAFIGTAVAVILSYLEKSLLTVAVCACASVYLSEFFLRLFV